MTARAETEAVLEDRNPDRVAVDENSYTPLIQALTNTALAPDSNREAVLRVFAEHLTANGQGFALLRNMHQMPGWRLTTLYGMDGKQHSVSPSAVISFKNGCEIDLSPATIHFFSDWKELTPQEDPALHIWFTRAFPSAPVISAPLEGEQDREEVLLLIGRILTSSHVQAVMEVAERLALCLAMVQIREQLHAMNGEQGRLFDEALAPLMLLDPGGVVLRINNRMQALLDVSEVSAPRCSLANILPGAWRWFQRQRDLEEGSKRHAYECTHVTDAGVQRCLRFALCAVHFKGEQSWMITADDLSKAARLEVMLQRLDLLKEEIVNHLTVGMVVQDVHGRFAHVNQAAADMFGYTIEDLLGESIEKIVSPDQLQIMQQSEIYTSDERRARYEVEFQHKNGDLVHVLVSESPFEEQGRVAGTIRLLTDVTPQRRAEHRLLEQDRAFQRVLGRMRALNQATSGALKALDADIIMRLVGEELLCLGMTCVIASHDPVSNHWEILHSTAPIQWEGLSMHQESLDSPLQLPAYAYHANLRVPQSLSPERFDNLQQVMEMLGAEDWPLQPVWEDAQEQACLLTHLRVGDRISGFLLVFGEDVSDDDIPAVTAFANHLSIAMESARLFSESIVAAHRAKSLAEIAAAGGTATNGLQLLHQTSLMLLEAARIPACSIFHLDLEKDTGTILLHVTAPGSAIRDLDQLPAGSKLSLEVSALHQPGMQALIDLNTLHLIENHAQMVGRKGEQIPCVVYPMETTRGCIGLAVFYLGASGRRLLEQEQRFLQTAVEQMTIGYEKTRLAAQAQHQNEVEQSLSALVERTLASLNVEDVVQAALQGIADLLPCSYCSVATFDFDAGNAHVLGAIGAHGRLKEEETVSLDAWGCAADLASGQPVVQHDAPEGRSTGSSQGLDAGMGYRSWLSLPLQAKGQIFGALALGSHQAQAFTPTDVDLAQRFADHLAVALDNAHHFLKARKSADELRALYDLAQDIASELELHPLLRTSLASACKLLGTQQGTVFLVDSLKEHLHLVAQWNLLPPAEDVTLSRGQGLAGLVWKKAGPLVLESGCECGDPAWLASCYANGAAIGVPLFWAGEVRGVFCVYEPNTAQTFSQDSIRLLERMAAQVALGMESAHKHEQLRRKVNQLRVVQDIGRRITSILHQEQLLEQIVRQVAHSFGLELVVLYLQIEGALVESAAYYLPEDCHAFWDPTVLAIGREGICGLAASEGRPILVQDVSQDEDFLRLLPVEAFVRSAVAIPLKLKGEVIGVMLVESERLAAFDETDVDTLQALGAHVSTGIENARLYEQTKNAQERMLEAEKLRSLGLMTAGIAHDFNNLLAVISARAELALRVVDNPLIKGHLKQVISSARDGSEIIRRLQNFARTNQESSEFGVVDVNDMVAQAVEFSRPRWKDEAQGNGIHIEVFTQLRATGNILGSPSQLREILINLIFNAIEAMPDGGSITIDTCDRGELVSVVVKDIGLGMSEEAKQQIFVPYFTTKRGGTGLGMSMVYGVVKRHRGEIDIQSTLGVGTSVRLLFPAVSIEKVQEQDALDAPSTLQSESLSIMVVEDEDAIRDGLVEIFSNAGHRVFAASHGEEAMELLQQHSSVDIVFSDLAMPQLSGWQLIQQLREHDPELPIVVLSGWGGELDPELLKQYAIRRVIPKPFSLADLQAVLDTEIRA